MACVSCVIVSVAWRVPLRLRRPWKVLTIVSFGWPAVISGSGQSLRPVLRRGKMSEICCEVQDNIRGLAIIM